MHDFLQKERRSLTQRRLQVTFVPGPAPELQWMLRWTFWFSGISMNTLFNTKSLTPLNSFICFRLANTKKRRTQPFQMSWHSSKKQTYQQGRMVEVFKNCMFLGFLLTQTILRQRAQIQNLLMVFRKFSEKCITPKLWRFFSMTFLQGKKMYLAWLLWITKRRVHKENLCTHGCDCS